VLDGDDKGRERELEALRLRTEQKKATVKAKIEEERGLRDKVGFIVWGRKRLNRIADARPP